MDSREMARIRAELDPRFRSFNRALKTMRKENTQMFELLERFAAAIPPEPGIGARQIPG